MTAQFPFLDNGRASHSKAAPVEKTSGGFDFTKFVESFPVMTEAAGGLAEVRRLVLDLAIRGRLSATRPEDRPVRELLDRATRDRMERLRCGTARQMNDLAPVDDAESPFTLPPLWAWTRIHENDHAQVDAAHEQGLAPPRGRLTARGASHQLPP